MPVSEVRATVGRFVSIRSGSSVIVAMITEVSCENMASSDNYIANASVDLLGEILNAKKKKKKTPPPPPTSRNSSAASPTTRPLAMPST